MRRKLVSGVLALALAGCAQAGTDDPGASSQTLVPAQAVEVAVAPPDATPADARGQFFLGLRKHDAGLYPQATELFLAAARTFPVARALAARSLMEEGRLAEAYRQAVQATREAPLDPTTHFMLGLVASRDERADEAREAYLRCLDLDPTNAGAHNNLGGLYYHREDFYRARVETDDALRLAEGDLSRSIAEANLGELDALAGHLQDAEAHDDRALELAPEAAHGYFALAVLYDVTGREAASRKMASIGVNLDPTGAGRRAISFVWPELELHHDALMAEARGDDALARRLWTSLLAHDQGTNGPALRWSPLQGRAASHLEALATPAWAVAAEQGQHQVGVQVREDVVLSGISPTIQQTHDTVGNAVEVFQGYTEFQRNQPQPPHKCD